MNTVIYVNIKNLITELLIIAAIVSAILVIISKNPIVSVIYLIALFLNTALFLVVKGMPFIGISYILVYLGAIIVLFLFVIMMININLTDILEIGSHYTKNIPLALIVSGLFLYEFLNIIPSYLNYAVFSSFEQGLNHSFFYNFFTDSTMFVNNIFLYITNVFYSKLHFLGYASEDQTLSSLTESIQNNTIVGNLSNYINPLISYNNWPETTITSYSHIVSIAYSLYTYGVLLFLITSVILLLALVTPIYLSGKS